MKYFNINPDLDDELLESIGFLFDGYYYVKDGIPFKLLKSSEGYEIVSDQLKADEKSAIIKNYSELISILAQVSRVYLYNELKDKNFISVKVQISAMNDLIAEYWKFDTDLKFYIVPIQNGFTIMPVNEYTYSLTNGFIHTFEAVIVNGDDNEQSCNINFECNPQCVCLSYLVELSKNMTPFEKFIVAGVKIHLSDGTKMDYYGCGIPKINME